MNRKICVVTGTRAEFGLLSWLMKSIDLDYKLSLQVLVTGMHLSPEFGNTYKEILEAGFHIDEKVEVLLSSDSTVAMTKSMGLGVIGFADSYERLAPDVIVVLGDRFEIFSAVSAALLVGIPVVHIHGGEVTEGAIDDAIRHSITKMSQLHFVSTEEYRQRVIQLGEHPSRVFNVGGMGVDAINKIQLMERSELEDSLNLSFGNRNLLVTFHPVTIEGSESSAYQMGELLEALSELDNTTLIFTMPNADSGGHELGSMIEKFVANKDNAHSYKSLGQIRYLSCLAQVDGVIGNSSSGLLEAPSFNIGTINIGERQRGRIKAKSVIDCQADKNSIKEAIKILYSENFRTELPTVVNPYGSGGACETIVDTLAHYPLENIRKKEFYDLVQK